MANRPAFGEHIVTGTLDRELKQARAIFILIGLLNIVISLLAWNTAASELKQLEKFGIVAEVPTALKIAVYIGVGIGVVYLACAALVFKKPIPTTITGLVIYCAFTVLQLAVDPSAVLSLFGIGLRTAIIIALITATHFAFAYERNRARVAAQPR